MAHALQSGLRDGGLRRGGLHAGLGNGSIFNIASLDLNFAKYKNIGSLVTFTRASSGTFVDSSGVLRSAVTNLVLRSEEFDTSWVRFGTTTLTTNTVTAPNGTLTADNIVFTSASAGIYQTVTGLASTTYTFSIWIKSSSSTQVRIVINTNLSDPVIQTVTVTSAWQRFNISKTTSAGTNSISAQVQDNGSGGTQFDLWGAQLEQSSTVGEYIPTTSVINSAPRFDHNPTTGESLGLLVEEQRTNSVVNSNSMTAVVTGSPGTLPTGYSAQGNTGGWTREVIGSGSIGALNYVDIRFSGTPTGSQFSVGFQSQGVVAASNGQSWAASVYHQLVGGAISNIGCYGAANLWNSSVAFIGSLAISPSSFVPTSTLQRFGGGGTISAATTASINWGITFTCTIGNTYDFTIRFAGPQLELGAFPTSYIPTTTAAATRSADVASITGTAFSSWYRQDEGTVFVNGSAPRVVESAGGFLTLNDPAGGNRIDIRQYRHQPFLQGGGGSSTTWSGILPTITPNVNFMQAVAYSSSSQGNAISGVLEQSTTALLPIVATRMALAMRDGQTAPSGNTGGTFKRICFWPQRLANNTLQSITQ